jgi:hypothetical protein
MPESRYDRVARRRWRGGIEGNLAVDVKCGFDEYSVMYERAAEGGEVEM